MVLVSNFSRGKFATLLHERRRQPELSSEGADISASTVFTS
jgi:hypothetical protein